MNEMRMVNEGKDSGDSQPGDQVRVWVNGEMVDPGLRRSPRSTTA